MKHPITRIPVLCLMSLLGIFADTSIWAGEAPRQQTLLINNLGWPADAPKTVLARDAGPYKIIDESGKIVFTGELARHRQTSMVFGTSATSIRFGPMGSIR